MINRASESYQLAYYGIIKWIRKQYSDPSSPIHTIERIDPFSAFFDEMWGSEGEKAGEDLYWVREQFQEHFCNHFNQYPPNELHEEYDCSTERDQIDNTPEPTDAEEIEFNDRTNFNSAMDWVRHTGDWNEAFWSEVGELEDANEDDNFNYLAGLFEGSKYLFSRFI